jgi:hypothetical protein
MRLCLAELNQQAQAAVPENSPNMIRIIQDRVTDCRKEVAAKGLKLAFKLEKFL